MIELHPGEGPADPGPGWQQWQGAGQMNGKSAETNGSWWKIIRGVGQREAPQEASGVVLLLKTAATDKLIHTFLMMSPSPQTYQHRQVVQHGPSISSLGETLEIPDRLFLLRLTCESPCRVCERRQVERSVEENDTSTVGGERKTSPSPEGDNIRPQMWLLQPLILDEVVVFPHWSSI